MKNVKFRFLVLISILLILPISVFAESITNINGIEFSEEEYNNFLKIHTYEYIMTMDEETYEKLKGIDYDSVKTETIYVESTYNPHLGITTDREITEEEYNEYDIEPLLSDKGSSRETVAKKLTLSFATMQLDYNYVVTTATWKAIPATRSFDVIGIRGYGFSFRNGSQQGQQIYVENGEYKTINYGWNGTNIKKLDNGFGISMNIVNNTITALQLTVECDVKATIEHPSIYGSYQHATRDVSLADSQNYTLGGGGLGNVFIYPYSISTAYDDMGGVEIDF